MRDLKHLHSCILACGYHPDKGKPTSSATSKLRYANLYCFSQRDRVNVREQASGSTAILATHWPCRQYGQLRLFHLLVHRSIINVVISCSFLCTIYMFLRWSTSWLSSRRTSSVSCSSGSPRALIIAGASFCVMPVMCSSCSRYRVMIIFQTGSFSW